MNIAIVGNGPVDPKLFERIEQADFIVRFNAPPDTHVYAGMRTDQLVISNSSKQTQNLLASPAYLGGPVFSGARSILLPYCPEIIRNYMPKPNIFSLLKGRRHDLTGLCKKAAHARGKSVEILEAAVYHEACKQLGIPAERMRSAFPSSGMLAMLNCQNPSHFPLGRIRLFGFGFMGWKRHDWSAERLYVVEMMKQGRILSCS